MEKYAGSLGTLAIEQYIALGPELGGLIETIDGSELPPADEPDNPPLSVIQHSDSGPVSLTVAREGDIYIVSRGGDVVRFAYWSEPRTVSGKLYDDPYNLSTYEGGKRDLIGQSELTELGYSAAEQRIFAANAGKESSGKFGAVNTWDRQLVSWGAMQFAGRAGVLPAVLRELKRNQPACFARWFRANGVDVASCTYPSLSGKGFVDAEGLHLVVYGDDQQVYRGHQALLFMRAQPKLLGLLMLAGNDVDVAREQCRYWLSRYLRRALKVEVFGHPIGDYVTSEYGAAILVRLYNWMPGKVKEWCESITQELKSRFPGRDLTDPRAWNSDIEGAFLRALGELRKKLKGSDYGDYAADLCRERGSFSAPPSKPDPGHEAPADLPLALPDIDVTAKSPVDKRKRTREWGQITGIVLHQTGVHGFPAKAWHKVTAHLGVHSDGSVYWIHPLQALLWSSHGFNRYTVAIEVAGNFRLDESKPNSHWKDGGGPSTLTPEMVEGLRKAIRFIYAEVERHGGKIAHVFAHRQASATRPACPGQAIWQAGGVWAQEVLGLDDGGDGYTIDDGKPIPSSWDPRRGGGVRRGPAAEPDLALAGPEVDVEFLDDDALAELHARRRGVIIHQVPDGIAVRRESGSPTYYRGAPAELVADERDLVAAAFAGNDMELVERLVISSGTTRSQGLRGDTGADALRLEVPVHDDESAVALLEQDGEYRWLLPMRDGAVGARYFVLASDSLSAPNDDKRGLLGESRVCVFRFVARVGLDAGIRRFEGRRREGLVHLRGPLLNDWGPVEPESLPKDSDRVLMLIHGTFSSTLGCYGALALAPGRELLDRALGRGDLILGFDHHTLGKTPAENGAAIVDALAAADLLGKEIHVICHSRGGLVARCVAAELARRNARPLAQVLCVATTENGTSMANPDNWGRLADVVTNLAACTGATLAAGEGGAIAGQIVRATVTGVGCLMQALADVALAEAVAPGLAAMIPGGAGLAAVPAWTPAMAAQRLVLAANFEPARAARSAVSEAARNALLWAIDSAADRLFDAGDNDLVVDNASSLTGFDAAQRRIWTDVHDIHHLNFFASRRVADELVVWSQVDRAAPVKRPLRRPLPAVPELADARLLSFGDADRRATQGASDPGIIELFMKARCPAEVAPREQFWITVDVSRSSLAELAGVEVSAALREKEPVEVELVALENAEVGQWSSATLEPPGHAACVRLAFDARASGAGPLRLRVVLCQRGVVTMHVDLATNCRSTGASTSVEIEKTADNGALARRSGPLPEHQLTVFELREFGGIRLRYHLRSSVNGINHRFDSPLIPGSLADLVARQLDSLESDWDRAGRDAAKFERALASRGARLFEQLLPRELQALLWDHRTALDGLQVLSEESCIPWEMLCLKPPDRPVPNDYRFLAEVGLVRSHWRAALAAQLRRGKALYVAPDYPPSRALASSPAECEMLRELLDASPVAPPGAHAILSLLQSPGSFAFLHFVCRGAVDGDEPRLLLGERRGGVWEPDELTVLDVDQQARISDRQNPPPLVFLNTCSVGRGRWLQTSSGGWARAFLERGAGALVVPFWSVGDEAGRHFAAAFYESLLAGHDLARTSLAARLAARKLGDPTWLAYAVYADPHGRLV